MPLAHCLLMANPVEDPFRRLSPSTRGPATAVALLALVALGIGCATAESATEGANLDQGGAAGAPTFLSWEVAFTHPTCEPATYDGFTRAVDGTAIAAPPPNTYCTVADLPASRQRADAPLNRLIGWVDALEDGQGLFIAYPSFGRVAVESICDAIGRGANVEVATNSASPMTDELDACGATVHARDLLGMLKLAVVDPDEPDDADHRYVQMAFGGGNLSSTGGYVHHDAWNFAEVSRKSQFFGVHHCLIELARGGDLTDTPVCLSELAANDDAFEATEIAEGVRTRILPMHDDDVLDHLQALSASADGVDLASTRLANSRFIDAISARLADGSGFAVRLVADDDLYAAYRHRFDSPPYSVSLLFPDSEMGRPDGEALARLLDYGDFEARFVETANGTEESGAFPQFMRHRLAVFNGSAADHAVISTMDMDDDDVAPEFGLAYIVDRSAVVAAYRSELGGMWEDSRTAGPVATRIARLPDRY